MVRNLKQKIVLEVQMRSTKSKIRAREIVALTEGMTSLFIDEAKNQLVIIGAGMDIPILATKLRKKVGDTTIISIEEVKSEGKKKEEEAAKKKKEEEEKKTKEEEEEKKKEQDAKRKKEEEEEAANSRNVPWGYNHYYNNYSHYLPPPPPGYDAVYYSASDYPNSWFSW